jgi:hypothetical protein
MGRLPDRAGEGTVTLADLILPVSHEWARERCLVFPLSLAQRLLEVQDEVGDVRYRLVPTLLTDGRYLCNADLLTECVPGGFLAPAFARLNAGNFGQVEVIPWADVAAFLPPSPPLP